MAERDAALTQKDNNLTDLHTALAGREAEIASLQVLPRDALSSALHYSLLSQSIPPTIIY